jgi:hypothetical protein
MLDFWQSHLTFALLAFLALPAFGMPPRLQSIMLPCLLAVSFIHVGGLPLAAYLRGFTDDLAITTLLALMFATMVRLGIAKSQSPRSRWQLLLLFAAMALFLYPATLGLTYFDPYRIGYAPRPMLVVIGVLALALLMARNWLGAAMLGLATLAFSFSLKHSDNYWDYLLDPAISLYCLGAICHAGISASLARRKRQVPAGA